MRSRTRHTEYSSKAPEKIRKRPRKLYQRDESMGKYRKQNNKRR